jgi:hypothetical protein
MANEKWKVFSSLSILPNTQRSKRKGSPLALSPSLAGPFHIGNRKGLPILNANSLVCDLKS